MKPQYDSPLPSRSWEQCRYTDDGSECFEPWTCEEFIGRGPLQTCSMEWTCASSEYLVSCKGPVDDIDYDGAVDCTCSVNGTRPGRLSGPGTSAPG